MRHPGLLRFTEEEGTPGDPVAAVRGRTRAVATTAMNQGWSGPPWNVELLASLQGIRVKNAGHLGRGLDALWTSGRILVSHGAPPTRRRYSIAHEMVHSFLAPHDEGTDLSMLPPADRKAADGELEYLCQVGAAELLMPSESLRRPDGAGNAQRSSYPRARPDFEVSPEAAARRAVDLAAERCAALCARPWDGSENVGGGTGPTSGTCAARESEAGRSCRYGLPSFCGLRRGSRSDRRADSACVPRSSRFLPCSRPASRRTTFRRNVADWPAYPELGAVDMEAVPLPFRASRSSRCSAPPRTHEPPQRNDAHLMPHLHEKVQNLVSEWRQAGYPCDRSPAIAEILECTRSRERPATLPAGSAAPGIGDLLVSASGQEHAPQSSTCTDRTASAHY